MNLPVWYDENNFLFLSYRQAEFMFLFNCNVDSISLPASLSANSNAAVL